MLACFARADCGLARCRYFPTQAFNFAFKDTIKGMFPKANPKTDFWRFFAINLASGAHALAASYYSLKADEMPMQHTRI